MIYKAMASCRVSSVEQLGNNSLSRQAEAVRRAAEELNVDIPDEYWWSGSVSSKRGNNLKRKDIKEMMAAARKDKAIKYLIIDEPDRFMRSIEEAFYFEIEFRKLGVKIWYASDPSLNTDDTNAKLMKMLKYFSAEASNEERINKSINGHRKAISEGRYTFQIKAGYVKGTVAGIQEPHPVTWEYYRSALLRIAVGLSGVKEAMEDFNNTCPAVLGGDIKPYTFDEWKRLVADPFYAGIVEMGKQIQARNEHGLHKKMIEIEQHKKILEIMNGITKKHPAPRKGGNPKYPLNAVGVCDNCVDSGHAFKFTGSDHTNGRTPKIYEDYRCNGCGRVIKRDNFHHQVELQFDNIDLTKKGRDELLKALEVVWKQEDEEAYGEKERLSARIAALEKAKSRQVEVLSDPAFVTVRDDIIAGIEKKKVEITELTGRLSKLDDTSSRNKADFMRFALEFADNLGQHFLSLSLKNVGVCKQIVFPSGFWVSEDLGVYTPQISPIYRLKKTITDLSFAEKPAMVEHQGL